MTPFGRLLRSLGGAGAVANARRACSEIEARERAGEAIARRLDEVASRVTVASVPPRSRRKTA